MLGKRSAKKYDWDGWRLENNPYGRDFDDLARERMIKNSHLLLPYIYKYQEEFGKNILEVGPFFNPLVNKEKIKNKQIIYWENDPYAIKYLEQEHNARVVDCNINLLKGKYLEEIIIKTKNKIKLKSDTSNIFHSVVISNVLNYVNYKEFLKTIHTLMDKNGYLFINNTVNYGIPSLFSKDKPASLIETIKKIENCGFNILAKEHLESQNKKFQRNKTLILVAKKIK